MSTLTPWQKSSFSGGGSGDNCIEVAANWQKSSFSGGGSSADCLELGNGTGTPTHIHLRESDTPTDILTTAPSALHALLTTLKAGELR